MRDYFDYGAIVNVDMDSTLRTSLDHLALLLNIDHHHVQRTEGDRLCSGH